MYTDDNGKDTENAPQDRNKVDHSNTTEIISSKSGVSKMQQQQQVEKSIVQITEEPLIQDDQIQDKNRQIEHKNTFKHRNKGN